MRLSHAHVMVQGRVFQAETQLQVQLMEASIYSLPAGAGTHVLFNVPAPGEIPGPNKIAPPPSAPTSSDDEVQEDLDVWLGPSSTLPGKLSGREKRLKISLENISSSASHYSSRHCVRLSDYLRLQLSPAAEKEGAAIRPQLSFGSALHVGDGVNALCRVCSGLLAGIVCARFWFLHLLSYRGFHKPPLRLCSKGALCDYCHLHDGRRNRCRRSGREPGSARS